MSDEKLYQPVIFPEHVRGLCKDCKHFETRADQKAVGTCRHSGNAERIDGSATMLRMIRVLDCNVCSLWERRG